MEQAQAWARRAGHNFFLTVNRLLARKSPGLSLPGSSELFAGLVSFLRLHDFTLLIVVYLTQLKVNPFIVTDLRYGRYGFNELVKLGK